MLWPGPFPASPTAPPVGVLAAGVVRVTARRQPHRVPPPRLSRHGYRPLAAAFPIHETMGNLAIPANLLVHGQFIVIPLTANHTISPGICQRHFSPETTVLRRSRKSSSQIVTSELDTSCVKSGEGVCNSCHQSVVDKDRPNSSYGERPRRLPFRKGRQFQYSRLRSSIG